MKMISSGLTLAVLMSVAFTVQAVQQRGPQQPQPPRQQQPQQPPQQTQPQPGAQQQQQQQQQMAQAQERLRHMNEIAARAQKLSDAFGQQIVRAQGQQRERLRVFQQMCDSIQMSARETYRSMDRIQEMLQDETMTRDRDMQRDMDRMRQHFDGLSKNLEEALTTMERIRDRLQTSAPALQ